VVPEQSLFVAHWTHRLRVQTGVDVPAQSAPLVHCTHCCIAGSQNFCDVGQSADVLHPTHAPVPVLQICALPS